MSKNEAAPMDSVFNTKLKSKSKKKEIVCYDCKVPGHKRPECPLRCKKEKANAVTGNESIFTALNTSGNPNKDIWYVDSGCSKNMTSRRDWFQDISLKNNGSVTVANGEQIKCCGIGNILFYFILLLKGKLTARQLQYIKK